ncbi:MAG: glycerophosphodiester phosphodiesterase family protein [Robiginitomaculum sp.]
MVKIKDCLIVAAGKGTRIKGLGDLKPMINIGGKPLIEWAMLSAAKNGVENFVVVTGYKAQLLETFLRALAKKYGWNIQTVFNPEFDKANGISVLAGEPYLKSDFFLAMCDHLIEPALYKNLCAVDLPKGAVGLGVDLDMENSNVDLEDVTKVLLDECAIKQIDKKLTKYNAFDVGIFRATPSLFDAILQSEKQTGDCSISGGMRLLADKGMAFGIDIGKAVWFDVDCEDMHTLAYAWLQSKEEPGASNGKTPRQKIVAVAHRGSKKYAPENTLIAHEVAYSMGARAIEFDIRCTKDGHFILMHDANVSRTTNGTGRVSNMTLAEITALDAGIKMGARYKGEKVPSLQEALRNVRGRFAVDLDFKGGPKNSAMILKKQLDEEGFGNNHLVTIFVRRQHFSRLRDLCPQYALRPHYISRRRTKQLMQKHKLEVMGLRRFSFSFKAATAIRSHGMHLFCNVMGKDDCERGFQDSLDAGALFIQTDNLGELVQFLESRDILETNVLGRNFLPQNPISS